MRRGIKVLVLFFWLFLALIRGVMVVYAQDSFFSPEPRSGSIVVNNPMPTTIVPVAEGEEFVLTDVTVVNSGGSPKIVNIREGGIMRLFVIVTVPPTYSQSFSSGILFRSNVDAECNQCSPGDRVVVTVSGRARKMVPPE